MKITSQIFLSFLKCNTKCWLTSQGNKGKGNKYAEWLEAQSDSYCSIGIERLSERFPREECALAFAHRNLKTAKWSLAARLTVESDFRDSKSPRRVLNSSQMKMASQGHSSVSQDAKVLLVANLQAVEQLASKGQRRSQYIPIRFSFKNKVTIDDRLLLGFDALVLTEALGHKVSYSKIIRGDDYSVLKVKTTPLLGKTRKLIEKIVTLLKSPSPPDLVLNRDCIECEFRSECRQKAIENDELSLLQGMTTKEREMNHKKGIFTVKQLSYTFRPRRRPKWFIGKREKYHHSLKALAIREKKIHIVGNPVFKIDGTPVCLDVEALPDRGFYYLIGFRIRNKSSTDQQSLWAASSNDEEHIWHQFLSSLESVGQPVLIHYGSFETTFLRTMTKRYGKPPEGSVAADAIKSAVNLLSVIYGQIYFPCYSNGLKDIARFLGFEWSEPNVSGIQTILWRENWHNSHQCVLKQKLITYNSEDCEAICRVMDCLNDLANRNSKYPGTFANDFVRTDSLRNAIPFRFRRNQFVLREFEEINSAAYWDYQRDRLLLRSNSFTKRPPPRRTNRAKVIRPNKVVSFPPPSRCSVCGKTKIYKHQAYTKTILDLKYQNSGIKRWVTKYVYCRYRCPACNAIVLSSERFWNRQEKFGGDLLAMIIYLNIALRVPQNRVAIFFNEILGFNFSRAITNRFRSVAALYYKPATERLMERIIGGSLIHVDETKVNLKGQMGYVWAFSNWKEVVYFYSPTREGNWVLELLKQFGGVLVSDFYSVYDSVDCPQQKCLIHLIRDMNEDLLKEPFNTEMKSLTGDFACLVKPMIETVDRFGLKARFLRKHKKEVTRFVKSLSQQDFHTDVAARCKARLLKNQKKLFTFLDYDNVPWNNNNAEHAIKAFVCMRRDISGTSTESSIRNYLILLSLYETCRIRGYSFLEFLRSHETDIDAFAQKPFRNGSGKGLACCGPP